VKSIVDLKAQFRSLAEPWADTSTSTGRLMIAVLGGLADVERDLIRTRTAEGRQRAKARGVKLGRKPKLTTEQRREALARRTAGETLMEIARTYNVSFATISRLRPSGTACICTGLILIAIPDRTSRRRGYPRSRRKLF
jgi:DNA invertase Pin-like site-specific DNA recombinase